MFHTEYTDLDPCFGISLDELLQKLEVYETGALGLDEDIRMLLSTRSKVLSSNPHAIKVLEQRPSFIHICSLARNPNAIDLLANYLPFLLPANWLCQNKSPYLDTLLVKIKDMLRGRSSIDDYVFSYNLSRNPKGVPFLVANPEWIDWRAFSACPEEQAMDLLEQHPEKIDYVHLSFNPNPRAVALLRASPTKVNWTFLARNRGEEAVRFLLENTEKLNTQGWMNLSENTCPLVFPLLAANLDKVNWYYLSSNPIALPLLRANLNKVFPLTLAELARTQEQIDFLMENLSSFLGTATYSEEERFWKSLSFNPCPAALRVLKAHPEKVFWMFALARQNVFHTTTTYDYAGIRAARRELHEEYHAWAGHPVRVLQKAKDWGLEDFMEVGCL